MTSPLDAASGRWPELLEALAGLRPDQLTDRHQPCPACGGTDRYRWDRDDGPGGWFCNQCGGKDHHGGAGSGVDLLMRCRGWTLADASRAVAQHLGLERPIPPPPVAGAEGHWFYSPTVVVRRMPGKRIRPLCWDGSQWQLKAPPSPRPLYWARRRAGAPVLVVEGEGKADAAARLYPAHAVCSWMGGCKAVHLADWQSMRGQTAILWPDADDVGRQAMAKLAGILLNLGAHVSVVTPPEGVPQGWDLADADWTPEQAAAELEARAKPVEIQQQTPEPSHPPTDPITAARNELQAAVDDGIDGADLAILVARIAADADISPTTLQRLATELQNRARRVAEVGHEARALLAEADRREIGSCLTPDYLLPAPIAAAVQTVTRYLPGDGPSRCLPFLVAIAGLAKIGTIVEGIPAAGYRVPVNLYGCLVGRSGAKKSPTDRRLVVEPLQPTIDELNRANRARRQEWAEQCANAPKGQPKPEEPRPLRVTVSEFTGEALAEQLQQQETTGHGLLIHRDELAGLFGGLNAYRGGRGGDEQQLLEAFDGRGLTSLRVRGDRVYGRCQLSIWGGTQLEVLRDLVAQGDATGLWARFLFVPLPEVVVPLPVSTDPGEVEEVDAAMQVLQHVASTVYRLPPIVYGLTEAARAAFVGYEARHQSEALAATLGAASALYGKSAGKVLRLAGALHLISIAAGEASTDDPVDVPVIDRATALVDHLDGWALALHSSVAAGGIGQVMRLVHRIATAAGIPVRWKEIAGRLTRAQRAEIDSAAVVAAMEALAEAGYGEIQRGARGAVSYRVVKPLP